MSLKFKHYVFSLFIILLVGCGGSSSESNTDTEEPSASTAKTVLISHEGGVDFSEDTNSSEWEQQDGYTVVWSPTTYIAGEEWGKGVWFNVNVQDSYNDYIYIQSLGNVSLDSVTSVDTTAWHLVSEPLESLQKDYVYVVKTRDGHAKFKVLSVDYTSSNWNFTAEYEHTSSTSF